MNLHELRQEADRQITNINRLFDEIDEKIEAINITLYEAKINSMDEAELYDEYCNRIGDECGDFARILRSGYDGLDKIRWQLIDRYSVNQIERRLS